ncbi:hypothetical protein AGLY_007106 [Aphis glycines]|uniref:Uncharacterized protein n=1 Tax=Aphis glycines TaxID=307491 RepID=A0A6G0TPW0_APHGL|nr:hypothetical protein AGLY_007106 [Aphis glycines]
MYAEKGLVVLLLAFSAAVAHNTGWPRSKQGRIYRPNLGPRRLIQHVMMHEVEWANVLEEKVKVLGAPPYGGSLNYENDDKGPSILLPPKLNSVVEQGDDEKKEIAGTIASYTVRDIVATVARHFMSVRSFVEYGAEALRLATSCYTMKQSMLQISTIAMMMIKEHITLDVLAAITALKKNMVTYIDLLAFWPNDNITAMYNIYWEAVDVIQDNRIKSLAQIKYELETIKKFENYRENLQKLINEQCDKVETQDEIFRDMGIEQRPLMLTDPYLDLLVQFKDLKHIDVKQTRYVNLYVKKLKIHTMPTRMWSSVFLIKGSLEETRSGMSETTAEVLKKMSEEHPTSAETISGYSVDSRATEPSPEESGSADIMPFDLCSIDLFLSMCLDILSVRDLLVKGLVVLLLAFSAAVAHNTGWPRSKQGRIYRPNLGPRRLIQHVMMHEVEWANVLEEKVKVLGAPPYGGSLNYENDDKGPSMLLPPKLNSVVEQGDDEKKEIADTIASYTVRDIVATVARHFMSVRSFVEYGAEALRLATSCYTITQSMLQISTIGIMMTKEHNTLDVLAAITALKKNMVTYIDLLAFWPNDNITAMYNIYWEAVNIIQDEVYLLDQISYTVMPFNFLKNTEYLENIIDEQCSEMPLIVNEFFEDIYGVASWPPLVLDPYLDLLVGLKDLKYMGLKHMKHVDQNMKKLKINTMPSRLWSSVFLVKGYPEETRSDLFDTLTEVEKEMIEEYPKTAETISGPSVDSRAMEPSPEGSESADTTP